MKFAVFICLIMFISCSYSKENKLEDSIQTKKLRYIAWACACANWITPEDDAQYTNSENLAAHCFFIELSDTSIALPDTLGYSADVIEFTGQFYINKGYPKGYVKTEEPLDSAKIFRYTHYKVIESHYQNFKPK